MVRKSDLETCDGKEVSIQNLSPVSLPHRLDVVSVKVEDNTDVPDLNTVESRFKKDFGNYQNLS